MTHSYVCHDLFIPSGCTHTRVKCVAWRIHMCDITPSYVWYDSSICVLHAHTHDSLIYVAWRIHMCDITHSYMWYDSFICVLHPHPWLINMCGMTHSYVRYHLSWLIHESTERNPESWEATSHFSMGHEQWHHTYEKRPTLIKRDPYSWKETLISVIRVISLLMTHWSWL